MKTKTLTIRRSWFSTALLTSKGKTVLTANSFRDAITPVLCDYFIGNINSYTYKIKVARLSAGSLLHSNHNAVFKVVGKQIRDPSDNLEWASPMFVLRRLHGEDHTNATTDVHVCEQHTNWIFGKTNIGDMFVVTDITRKELE